MRAGAPHFDLVVGVVVVVVVAGVVVVVVVVVVLVLVNAKRQIPQAPQSWLSRQDGALHIFLRTHRPPVKAWFTGTRTENSESANFHRMPA